VTFVQIAFLGGMVTIVMPIVLHLIMRRQPRHLEFPALRFIKLRETANRRQMQLRHWLLLALRCLVLGLLALALARPSIVASGMLGDQEAPAAVALVFDTNPRMQYRQQNQSRLDLARETAEWLIPQFPPESDVAVVDSRSAAAVFSVDLGAARQRIARLDASAMTQPLALALGAALELVRESEKLRKEVYVFTDLSSASWQSDAMRGLAKQLQAVNGIGIYLIDVGAKDPHDFGLGAIQSLGDVLSKNMPLRIRADLVRTGIEEQRSVELYLINGQTQQPSMRGQQTFTFREGQAERTDFEVRGLPPGTHQGYLKIVGEDPLACDDQRWFTVDVRPAWRVLLAAPRDVGRAPGDYALFLSEALAPYESRIKGEAAFECDLVALDQLDQKSFDSYSAVCLIDPRPLTSAVWQKLHSYVAAGGGLGIFLGRNAVPIESFNTPNAQELLPGQLARQWRAAGEVYLAPENYEHPLLSRLRPLGGTIAWELSPVFHHWQLGDLAQGSNVVLSFSNNKPALLDRPVGQGRVVTWTTPVSDDPGVRQDVWNLLPSGEGSLAFFVLARETLLYLVGAGNERLNYTAGEAAVLHLGPERRFPIYSLTTPRGDQLRIPVDEKQNVISVTSTELPGNYRLQAGGAAEGSDLGFSVNLPPDVSRLEQVSPEQLKTVFGETPFRLAHNRDEIDRSVSAGRVGQELFPYLIVLLAVILACEQVVSNRFYQDYDTAAHKSKAAEIASATHAHSEAPPRTPAGSL